MKLLVVPKVHGPILLHFVCVYFYQGLVKRVGWYEFVFLYWLFFSHPRFFILCNSLSKYRVYSDMIEVLSEFLLLSFVQFVYLDGFICMNGHHLLKGIFTGCIPGSRFLCSAFKKFLLSGSPFV